MADQRTDEWFKMRLGLVTGTGFANVLAQGKGSAESITRRDYRIRLALERITGRRIEDFFETWDTKRGIALEPFARMACESAREYMVDEVDFVRHPTLQCGVSPDGLVDEDGGLEIKCPKPAIHLQYLDLVDDTPAIYKAQVQGGLMVTGRKWWDFASYCEEMPPELRLHIVRVKRDEVYIAHLERETVKFLAEVDGLVAQIQHRISSKRVCAEAVEQIAAAPAQVTAAKLSSPLAALLSA